MSINPIMSNDDKIVLSPAGGKIIVNNVSKNNCNWVVFDRGVDINMKFDNCW